MYRVLGLDGLRFPKLLHLLQRLMMSSTLQRHLASLAIARLRQERALKKEPPPSDSQKPASGSLDSSAFRKATYLARFHDTRHVDSYIYIFIYDIYIYIRICFVKSYECTERSRLSTSFCKPNMGKSKGRYLRMT